VVPEFLQEEASPENLAQALGNWLDAKDARQRLRSVSPSCITASHAIMTRASPTRCNRISTGGAP
jgi:lipid A disaccharide synthetase